MLAKKWSGHGLTGRTASAGPDTYTCTCMHWHFNKAKTILTCFQQRNEWFQNVSMIKMESYSRLPAHTTTMLQLHISHIHVCITVCTHLSSELSRVPCNERRRDSVATQPSRHRWAALVAGSSKKNKNRSRSTVIKHILHMYRVYLQVHL